MHPSSPHAYWYAEPGLLYVFRHTLISTLISMCQVSRWRPALAHLRLKSKAGALRPFHCLTTAAGTACRAALGRRRAVATRFAALALSASSRR